MKTEIGTIYIDSTGEKHTDPHYCALADAREVVYGKYGSEVFKFTQWPGVRAFIQAYNESMKDLQDQK